MIHWYMVNKGGMATLCTDKEDAEREAADAQRVWPHMGPHRAVQLVEAGEAFAPADMATAAAQEPYGCVTTHRVTGQQFFFRHPHPPYLDTARECVTVYTHPAPQQAAPAEGDALDAARWHWFAEYLVGPRTDLDDEIVASETVNELRKLVDAAMAAQREVKP